MKKIKFLAFLAMVLCYSPLLSQEIEWDYPIRPGSEEWAKLPNTTARINEIQVPESILVKLSDKQLLDIILDYPFFLDYAFSDDPFAGFQRSLGTLNAYREFESRIGSFNTIFDYYSNLDFSQINQLKEDHEVGHFSLRLSALELMMTDLSLKNQIPASDSLEYLKGISRKYNEKSVNEAELKGFGKLTAAFLAANMINGQAELKGRLTKEGKANLSSFVSNINLVSEDFIDELLNGLKKYQSIK